MGERVMVFNHAVYTYYTKLQDMFSFKFTCIVNPPLKMLTRKYNQMNFRYQSLGRLQAIFVDGIKP